MWNSAVKYLPSVFINDTPPAKAGAPYPDHAGPLSERRAHFHSPKNMWLRRVCKAGLKIVGKVYNFACPTRSKITPVGKCLIGPSSLCSTGLNKFEDGAPLAI
jgi:hypothetical protein